ncbi:MAG: hypothetical protein AAF911_10590 [Planctomycetota bacterium]
MNPVLPPRVSALLCCVLLLGLLAVNGQAQVGSALIAAPWQPEKSFSATNYFIGFESESDGAGFDTDLARGVSFGRFRLDNQDPRAVTFGWLYDHTAIDSSDPLLPERLVSVAFAAGMGLGEIGDGWELSFSAGGGTASDEPFADEEGWYGVGSLVATKRLDQRSALTLILDYDGSRAIFPDIPLPGIQYTVFESPSLRYSFGLPFSTLYYQPDDRWTFDVTYIIPIGGNAEASFKIDDQWSAYCSYTGTTRGYHLDGERDNERFFFQQSRLETGLRFTPAPGWRWTFAGGWAFDQEFTRGFDTRDDDDVRELDDAAFLRVGLRLDF